MQFKRQLISLALLSLSATAVLSQEANDPSAERFVSTASRAEVRSAAAAALRDGSLPRGELSYIEPATASRSSLTRAQVAAQAREAARLGLIAFGEGVARVATPVELEQVRMAGMGAAQRLEGHAAK